MNVNNVSTLPSRAKANIPQGWLFFDEFPTGTIATGQPAQAEKDISVESDEERTMSRSCSRMYFAMLCSRAIWRRADTAMSCFSSVMVSSRHLMSSVWVSKAGDQTRQREDHELGEMNTHA